jgi:hypothetical protein
MAPPTAARLAGAALALAAALAIAGFTALGSIFEYPQILDEPTTDILTKFRDHQGAVTGWFLVLTISAALLAPAGILLGRIVPRTLGRWIAIVGIAAATVQVVGLQRWFTLVPGISQDALDPAQYADAENRFEFLHTLLGKIIGETIGYALTATLPSWSSSPYARRSSPSGSRSSATWHPPSSRPAWSSPSSNKPA